MSYLTNVVRTDIGDIYAKNLEGFIKVLLKVNKEMPWFWQGLKGIDKAMTYGEMKEPWRGNDKSNIIEIECLEENVELTAIGLMELYRNSCFDLQRFVEVVPKNLREFSMDIYMSEVRTFQKDTDARNLGITDNPDSRINASGSDAKKVKDIHPVFSSNDTMPGSADSRPFVALRFTHCEFDMDSVADYFAEMSKNPELKKPTLKIKWGTCTPLASRLGPNLWNMNRDANAISRAVPVTDATDPSQMPLNTISPNAQQNVSSMDSLTNVHDASEPRAESLTERKKVGLKDLAKNTIGSIVDDVKDTAAGLVAGVTNALDSFSLQPNGIGNVHGTQIGGFAGNLLDKAVGDLTAKLLLDNVHGAGGLGSIQDAINGGLINAVGNLIQGELAGGSQASVGIGGGGANVGERIHGAAIDSSPDGGLNQKIHEEVAQQQTGPLNQKVYDPVAPGQQGPMNDNVHGGVNTGVDSTPDGNLNNNIHE
jgi:hypothetical protein